LYRLLSGLPLEGAVWRVQGRRDSAEMVQEWGNTLLQFFSGKRVKSPSLWKPQEDAAETGGRKKELIGSLVGGLSGKAR
jgi:hypothetical protein